MTTDSYNESTAPLWHSEWSRLSYGGEDVEGAERMWRGGQKRMPTLAEKYCTELKRESSREEYQLPLIFAIMLAKRIL